MLEQLRHELKLGNAKLAEKLHLKESTVKNIALGVVHEPLYSTGHQIVTLYVQTFQKEPR